MRYLFVSLLLCCGFSAPAVCAKDLLVFGADWCPGCVQLKAAIEQDPELVDGFEVSLIDIDQEPDIAKVYGVKNIPVLIVLEPGGKLRRKVGFRNVAELRAWLKMTN